MKKSVSIKFLIKIVMILLLILAAVSAVRAENPCAPRSVSGESVLCVCNATYCDDLARERPAAGGFVAYVSSEAGSRFFKTVGSQEEIGNYDSSIVLDADTKFQTIKGFGGAVTDAASINWKNMSEVLQQKLIETYFGDSGIGYSFIRVPIGGCDFSTHPYAYNELPVNDARLSNFTLAFEDLYYKIPMIKAARKASSTEVWVLATTWSPPVWMKTNNAWYGTSRLKDEYFQTYADYHLKFLEKYRAEGVPVWGITTTNEPFNGVVPLARFNSLGFDPSKMASYIVENLGPTIRNSPFNNTVILAVDDQRFTIPIWFNWVLETKPETLVWIDGVAVHFYGDFLTPASVLDIVTKHHTQKFVLATEACAGSYPFEKSVKLGSWSRAKQYILDIIEDLNHGVVGWLDWNMCLDTQGGPNWAKNFVDSPIIISDDQQEFWKQPMFYALGHFAKFVPRGSQRISAVSSGDKLYSTAFVTPNNTVVAVVYNDHNRAKKIRFQLKDKQIIFNVSKRSIATIELSQ